MKIRHTAEQIVAKLREAEVALTQVHKSWVICKDAVNDARRYVRRHGGRKDVVIAGDGTARPINQVVTRVR